MEIPQELLDLGVTSLEQTELDLEFNNLTSLPESIGLLTNLERLDLSANELTELPKSIGKLTNLKELNLTGNKLDELPESFGQLTKLEKLRLSGNYLEELPESIGLLTNLKELNLSGNFLSSLPENLENLKNLVGLYIDTNKLDELPHDFCDKMKHVSYWFNYNYLDLDGSDGFYKEFELELELFGTIGKKYNKKHTYMSDMNEYEFKDLLDKYQELHAKQTEFKTREDGLLIFKNKEKYNPDFIKRMEDKVEKMIDEMDGVTQVFLYHKMKKSNCDFTLNERCEECELRNADDYEEKDWRCYCKEIRLNNLACDIGCPFRC